MQLTLLTERNRSFCTVADWPIEGLVLGDL
jgi:hypothetical protein